MPLTQSRPRVALTLLLTAPARLAARRNPPPRLLHGDSRVCSTTNGRRDSISPARPRDEPSAAAMNEGWNPTAMPFRPGSFSSSSSHGARREQNFYLGYENQAPTQQQFPPFPPPHPFPPGPMNAPWEQNFAPPPPPFFGQNPGPPPFFEYAAQAQAQAQHHQWMQQQQQRQQHQQYQQQPQHQQNPLFAPPGFPQGPPGPPGMHSGPPGVHHGPPGIPPGPPPYGMPPPGYPPMHGPPSGYGQQRQQAFPSRGPPHMAIQGQMNMPFGGRGEDYQRSTPPPRKTKSGAAANGQAKQKENSNPHKDSAVEKKGRYGDNKIMLPAPQPTADYLAQAAGEPSASDTPHSLLVILDLNGTVLHRPNKNAKTMIERPFLKPFLRYLFQNFKVMVWSSAKPDNVKSLVSQALDNNLRSQLVAQWARDSFGLSPTNYSQNVQVYKNLKLVWSRSTIQSHHPDYEAGGRFGQHNTVLIDDSMLKANAQPHNLLEIPEFAATPEQMQGDALREVAGYLEVLRQQEDVSRYIRTEPFVGDGRWSFEWPNEVAGGGEMTTKAGGKKNSKKNKKKQANVAVLENNSQTESSSEPKDIADALQASAGAAAPLDGAIDALQSVSLVGFVQKDW
ncbi:hypothetical protein T440DRAFT_472710 [Plenodomus tracheiphilus IPT5]|uniref:FCP1 homology domain-containing protein n=1 Tax=Plenodomus tracheiphilus IPT5 TaxID=1408161 RepID=A0A6A7APZ4_9PLEO|nr:hypothetical protein T440DRAFT_472710 [Plenodomus tracheiphilus IPT5]